MKKTENQWTMIVYKIPPQPTRLRLQIWRQLQKLGGLYLQDGICLVPDRPDLTENMHYIATSIDEMGGTCHLFAASAMLPGDAAQIQTEFRSQADARLGDIVNHLDDLQARLDTAITLSQLERFEEELKRERIAYLRARKLAYFGSNREQEVDASLERLKTRLDNLYREK